MKITIRAIGMFLICIGVFYFMGWFIAQDSNIKHWQLITQESGRTALVMGGTLIIFMCIRLSLLFDDDGY